MTDKKDLAIVSESFNLTDVEWTTAPDHRTYYVNQIALALTQFDIQLRLAQTSALGGKPLNLELATVFLSPFQAKALVAVLSQIVQTFEANNNEGRPLPLPAQLPPVEGAQK